MNIYTLENKEKENPDATPPPVTRNFITENVQNIQKLQDNFKTVAKHKSETELRKSVYRQQLYDRIEHIRAKMKNRGKKQKGHEKKRSKSNKSRTTSNTRPRSPLFEENTEPESFMETFAEPNPGQQTYNIKVINVNPKTGKPKKIDVRDCACQYGDPKGTLYFEDGSNINIYIPGRDKFLNKQDKIKDANNKNPFVVSSRYMLFKKKTFDDEMKKQTKAKPGNRRVETGKSQMNYATVRKDYSQYRNEQQYHRRFTPGDYKY